MNGKLKPFYSHSTIIELFEQGLKPKEIQTKIRCSRTTVLRVLKGRLPPRRKEKNVIQN